MTRSPVGRCIGASLLLAVLAAWLNSATAQQLSGAQLVRALQEGGYVIVIRNGRSYEDPPATARDESPGNLRGEREIDDYGQGQMSVLGYAFRELRVPVAYTLTSPAYRSRQSANYFGFGERMAIDTLAEGGDASWLAQRVAEAPPAGGNTVIMTHGDLITAAFGRDARDFGTAETLIFRPGDSGANLVARLSLEDWASLAVVD